jgi:hypothetical protein
MAYGAIGDYMSGMSLFELTDQALSRVLICGECPEGSMDSVLAKGMMKRALSKLVDKICRFNEYGSDSETQTHNRKRVTREYRKTNLATIHLKAKTKTDEKRIKQLKEKL